MCSVLTRSVCVGVTVTHCCVYGLCLQLLLHTDLYVVSAYNYYSVQRVKVILTLSCVWRVRRVIILPSMPDRVSIVTFTDTVERVRLSASNSSASMNAMK